MDGKTYYYLYNTKDKIIHICSNGETLCGLKTEGFAELNFPEGVSMNSLASTAYKLCDNCVNYKPPKIKKTKFETKAEFMENPQEE
jgi:hypothetical protein